MNDQPKKDHRPEGGILLEATMMAELGRAHHLAIRAVESGRYQGGDLTSEPSLYGLDINSYQIKLEEK